MDYFGISSSNQQTTNHGPVAAGSEGPDPTDARTSDPTNTRTRSSTVWIRATGAFTGSCLDVRGPLQEPGTPTQIWTCKSVDEMLWIPFKDGTIHGFGNLCLSADNSPEDGSRVYMDTCSGRVGQIWKIPSDTGHVKNGTGLCLDIQGPSTALGTAVQLWHCQEVDQHKWQFEAHL
ncbi:RICIN domain-containing protein [Actinomadura chibensis]